ncbi:MAG: murein biosynthesis integral membrane protein MurJ, partial [Bifidobacterium psychraerophilum]
LGAATGSSTSDTSKSAWPEMTNVPFPGSTSADASASSSAASSSSHSATSSSTKASDAKVTHADKNASAAPSPSPTPTATQNTTAFATGTQTFLNQPAGLQGRGWYVHLTEPQQVTRLVISIRQSGGQGQIYANSTASSPNQGDPVAQFAFDASGTTTVTLSKPVSTQDLVVWVPLDTTPSGGLYFNSVQVF